MLLKLAYLREFINDNFLYDFNSFAIEHRWNVMWKFMCWDVGLWLFCPLSFSYCVWMFFANWYVVWFELSWSVNWWIWKKRLRNMWCAFICFDFGIIVLQMLSRRDHHFYYERVKTILKLQFFVILLKIVIIQNFSLVFSAFKIVM